MTEAFKAVFTETVNGSVKKHTLGARPCMMASGFLALLLL